MDPLLVHPLQRDPFAPDLRDLIFADQNPILTAAIIGQEEGVIAGLAAAVREARTLELDITEMAEEGRVIGVGSRVLLVRGRADQILRGEDRLLGPLSKPSGVATAAWRAVEASGGRVKIVAGAWKKVPAAIKNDLRQAVQLGGAALRITEEPFLYLDKNYVRAFGGIGAALRQTRHITGRRRVVQLRGETGPIAKEASEALQGGADIIMIDTARPRDIEIVSQELHRMGCRGKIQLAFGGRIRLLDIPELCQENVDILDIGAGIVDAPLLDLRYEVIA